MTYYSYEEYGFLVISDEKKKSVKPVKAVPP